MSVQCFHLHGKTIKFPFSIGFTSTNSQETVTTIRIWIEMIGKSDKLFHYDKNCLVYQLHYVIKTTYNPNNNKKKKTMTKNILQKYQLHVMVSNAQRYLVILNTLIMQIFCIFSFATIFIMFFIFVFSFAFFFQFDFFYKIKKMVQYWFKPVITNPIPQNKKQKKI